MIKKILSLLSLGFIMTGCTVQPAKIPYTAVETNQKVNVYSVIEQDELDALYPIQRAGDHFGLIGSLSDAAENARRAKVTERNLLDIRNELIEFNFDQIFNEEVTNKLKNNVHINNVSSYKSTKQLDNKIMAGETYQSLIQVINWIWTIEHHSLSLKSLLPKKIKNSQAA